MIPMQADWTNSMNLEEESALNNEDCPQHQVQQLHFLSLLLCKGDNSLAYQNSQVCLRGNHHEPSFVSAHWFTKDSQNFLVQKWIN